MADDLVYFEGNEREDEGFENSGGGVNAGPFSQMSDEDDDDDEFYGPQSLPPSGFQNEPHVPVAAFSSGLRHRRVRENGHGEGCMCPSCTSRPAPSPRGGPPHQTGCMCPKCSQWVAAQREMDRMRPPPSQYMSDPGPYRQHNPYAEYARQQPPQRVPKYRVARQQGQWRSWLIYLLGLALIGGVFYVYVYVPNPIEAALPPWQFPLHPATGGYKLRPSVNLTEHEITSKLIKDVQLRRVLIDLSTHLRRSEGNHTCLCMHHLTGFIGDIPPRKLCAVYNKRRDEVDYLANPYIIRAANQGVYYAQRSLACRNSKVARRLRPTDVWLEWDMLRTDPSRPEGARVMTAHGRFSGIESACLMLSLEEMEGRPTCVK